MSNSQDVLTMLLTTGVITTLVTSLVNIAITLKTNKNVKDVEKLKRKYQMDFMRFEKINGLRVELSKYLNFSPNDVVRVEESSEEKGRAVTRLINENEEMIELFEKNSLYFDVDLRNKVERIGKEYRDRRWALQQLISGIGVVSNNEKFDEELPKLFKHGYEFKKVFEGVIEDQMRRLDITSE